MDKGILIIIKVIATLVAIFLVSMIQVSTGTSGGMYIIVLLAVIFAIWKYNPETTNESKQTLNKD